MKTEIEIFLPNDGYAVVGKNRIKGCFTAKNREEYFNKLKEMIEC